MQNGKRLHGYVIGETADRAMIKLADGKTVWVDRDEIKEVIRENPPARTERTPKQSTPKPAYFASLMAGLRGSRQDQAYSMERLARLGNAAQAAVPELRRIATQDDWLSAFRAAVALAGIAPADPRTTEALPALFQVLLQVYDDGTRRREEAAQAIRRIAPDEVPKLLEQWTQDLAASRGSDRRRAATRALGAFGAEAKGAVSALVERLKDEAEPAARALGRIGPPAAAAIPRLLQMVDRPRAGSRGDKERLAAVFALARIQPEVLRESLRKWASNLESSKAEVRRQALDVFKEAGPAATDYVPQLVRQLGKRQDRKRAIAAVTEIGEPVLPNLMTALEHWDSEVRASAAIVLGSINTPAATRAAPKLFVLLTKPDEDSRVRREAANALGRLGEKGARYLIRAVENDKLDTLRVASVRELAARALARETPLPQEATLALSRLLRSADVGIAKTAAGALAAYRLDALPHLRKALRDSSPAARAQAAKALHRMGVFAVKAVPDLAEALNDKDAHVRSQAAQSLGNIGPAAAPAARALVKAMQDGVSLAGQSLQQIGKGSVPALRGALKNTRDSKLRRNAVHVLGTIGADAKDAVSDLSTLLEDEDSTTRWYAAVALGRIGPHARLAVPALKKALSDPSPNVRRQAEEALRKIGAD